MNPIIASTPKGKLQKIPAQDARSISHISPTEGNSASKNLKNTSSTATQINKRNKRTSQAPSLQSIKESFSKAQSHIIELFSRGDTPRSTCVFKVHPNPNNKVTDTETKKLSSESNAKVAAPSPSPVNCESTVGPVRGNATNTTREMERKLSSNQLLTSNVSKSVSKIEVDDTHARLSQQLQDDSKAKQDREENWPVEKSSSQKQLDFSVKKSCSQNVCIPAGANMQEEKLVDQNQKLVEENHQLREENQTLRCTLKVVQQQLEQLEKKEIIWQNEGQLLAGFIRECHRKITQLQVTQCELIKRENEKAGLVDEWESNNRMRKIHEHFIAKY